MEQTGHWDSGKELTLSQLKKMLKERFHSVDFEAYRSKCYHLGVGRHVTRNNLAKANENRDFRIFENFAYHMIELARKKRAKKIFGFKVHTLLHVETQVPSFLLITEAKVNDVKAMDSIPLETGSYYIFDKAYNDFGRLARIDSTGCFFVVRVKTNMLYEVVDTKDNLADNILKDCRINLTGCRTKKLYGKTLRMVEYYDAEDRRIFTYLTNSNRITASRVAELYKNRWLVELFLVDTFILMLMQFFRIKRNRKSVFETHDCRGTEFVSRFFVPFAAADKVTVHIERLERCFRRNRSLYGRFQGC